MRYTETIKSGEVFRFSASQSGKYLIIREASAPVVLRGDSLRNTEIERGDTVDVSAFTDLEFYNHLTTDLLIDFQVVDIAIQTKAQKINVENQMSVSGIDEPITIGLMPDVTLKGISKVELTNTPTFETVTPKMTTKAIGALTMTGNPLSINGNAERSALMLQADIDNSEPVIVAGFLRVYAGSTLTLPMTGALSVTGAAGDALYCGEVL